MTEQEQEWYKQNGHVHCPLGCEHPEESMINGRMLCMRCLVLCGIETEVEPCTPKICN